jgi:hypothetical protein
VRGRRGVRRLAVVLVVLSCLTPTGAEGQSSTAVTTATTSGDHTQASDIARVIASLQSEPTTTTTRTAGDGTRPSSVGPAKAALEGGTTTTTLPPTVIDSEADLADLAPPAPATVDGVERSSSPSDRDASASRIALTGTTASSPIESPLEGTTTTAVASPPSVVIADLDEVALPEEPGGVVRLPAVGLETRHLARWMLLFALLLLVAPSVVQALRGDRR